MFSAKTGDFVITTPDGVNHFGAILNIKEYTDGTYPGILNGLKYLDFEYVITHSFSPMGRQDALKVLDRTKGMMISSGDKAFSQIAELDHAMDQLASGNFVLGEYHFTMAIYADSQEKLSQHIATTRAELSNAGFVSVKEDLAVVSSFYSQFPGNWKYRTRIANVSSLNFLGLSPLHNFATGKKENNPWGECVTTLQTTNGQPYYFNFHATHPAENSLGEKAIANTMVIGKSGTGKTALINFLLSQVQKLKPSPTIFFFDKDRGAEIFVRACGGNYLALENGQPTGFNPFQCERNEANVQFLAELIKVLAGKSIYSSREEEDIFRAVENMLDTPMHLRNMTNFQKSLPNMGDDGLFVRMRKWTAGNSLGWVFDNPVDTIDLQKANIIGFDYTEIIDNPEVRVPVINYLLHRLEALIDGRPLIYVMDEFWKILDGKGGLKEFAKNKQKTIRKQNGLGIFATQSPEDALASDIAAALIEQTATMILLPNPNASREDYIDGLKLTDAEYQVVVSLDERSRCFLVKQGHASAVCQLNLRGMDDALAVISASTDNIEIMHAVLQRAGGSRRRRHRRAAARAMARPVLRKPQGQRQAKAHPTDSAQSARGGSLSGGSTHAHLVSGQNHAALRAQQGCGHLAFAGQLACRRCRRCPGRRHRPDSRGRPNQLERHPGHPTGQAAPATGTADPVLRDPTGTAPQHLDQDPEPRQQHIDDIQVPATTGRHAIGQAGRASLPWTGSVSGRRGFRRHIRPPGQQLQPADHGAPATHLQTDRAAADR